ncbi:uncharacterized protein KY384_002463 [Bacidia gigantensis]|uniref:uncharacterized protein n=1 Tax=Bacidia gigantensis TaxID=2732470 RepID=UPI001D044BB0|nr:uncharacterized protein KY384_002463 [Bacidia gigantensis]KAG8532586.1 hypothetical protein KY384_002463 [Bacidia gigantensis]
MRSRRSHKRINYNELSSDNGLETAEEDTPKSVLLGTPSEKVDTDVDDVNGIVSKTSAITGRSISRGSSSRASPEVRSSDWHYDSSKTGFMDLPVEIRLSIYKLVLVTKDCIEFGRRINFPHSSALLSVNRIVAREAAPILSEWNTYQQYTLTSLAWKFVGPTNLGLLRTIFLKFDDATPSDEPKLLLENRRFQYNEDLSRSLEVLGKYATGLELLKVAFCGRQKFRKGDTVATQNFTNILVKLKADVVIFEDLYINRYSNRASNAFDLWPYEGGKAYWGHHPRENKIDARNQDFFEERLVRKEPINSKIIAAFEKAQEEGEMLRRKHKLEGRPYIWY